MKDKKLRKKKKTKKGTQLISLLLIAIGVSQLIKMEFRCQNLESQIQANNVKENKGQSSQGHESDPIEQNKEIADREKVAFLTFDDGPSRNTENVLDILDKYGIQGTFFIVGSEVQGRADSEAILNRMLEAGHYIGLHSMTHDVKKLYQGEGAPQHFLDEMLELQGMVKKLTGGFESQLYRAPYGTYGTFSDEHVALMLNSNLKGWDWNVDTSDWNATSVTEIMENVKQGMKITNNPNRLVILFHEKDMTVKALPTVIEYLLEQGYEFLPYDWNQHFPVNLINHPDL